MEEPNKEEEVGSLKKKKSNKKRKKKWRENEMGDGGLGNGEVWEERESGWGSWGR